MATVSPNAMSRTFHQGRESRTPYAPFNEEIMEVIPLDAEDTAKTIPNAAFPPPLLLVTSLIVFANKSDAAGGRTCER